jgi:hypothetical protein
MGETPPPGSRDSPVGLGPSSRTPDVGQRTPCDQKGKLASTDGSDGGRTRRWRATYMLGSTAPSPPRPDDACWIKSELAPFMARMSLLKLLDASMLSRTRSTRCAFLRGARYIHAANTRNNHATASSCSWNTPTMVVLNTATMSDESRPKTSDAQLFSTESEATHIRSGS